MCPMYQLIFFLALNRDGYVMIDWYSVKDFCDHMLTSFLFVRFFFRCVILYLLDVFIVYEVVICIIHICWIDDVVSLYLLLLKLCVLRVLIAFYSVLVRTICCACYFERISLLSLVYTMPALCYHICMALCSV